MKQLDFIFRLLLGFIFCTSGLVAYSQPSHASDSKWTGINVPSEGVGGQWVLAGRSDIRHLVRASDGSLYCWANPDGSPYRLFKSTDGGAGWSYTGRVTEDISAIVVLPSNPDIIFYSTNTSVFKSIDAGKTFDLLVSNPGGAESGDFEITSMDAAEVNGINYVAIATRNKAEGNAGGAFILKETQPFSVTSVPAGARDILIVAFSPRFAEDGLLTLVGTDKTDTTITLGKLEEDAIFAVSETILTGIAAVNADIAFPVQIDSNNAGQTYDQFLALDTGTGSGGVYRINSEAGGSLETIRLDKGLITDAACLAVSTDGEKTVLLAGVADRSMLFFSDDSGENWRPAQKPPSGDYVTGIVMAPDFAESGLSFAVTAGAESAFSVSRDFGAAWNQTGLIDTRISAILDLSIPAADEQNGALYLLTADSQNSLWYSTSQGAVWERVMCSSTLNSERFNLVLLSPNFRQNKTVLLAGTHNGSPSIWKSTDAGQTFSCHDSTDQTNGAPVNIDCWAFTPDDTLFVSGFDGDHSSIYQTAANSLEYIERGTAGRQVIHSLAFSPDYVNDHTLLAGNILGEILISTDDGLVFESLPYNTSQPPLDGNVTVAFDAGFGQNRTIYAADDTSGRGLFRFTLGDSISWQPLGSGLPDKARMGQMAVSRQGVVYALDMQAVDSQRRQGGIQRCLDPTLADSQYEAVAEGLEDGLNLKILRIQDNRLWVIDSTHNRILTWKDSLAVPVVLASPAEGEIGLDASRVDISWRPVNGASAYLWQVDTDAGFLNPDKKLNEQTNSHQIRLTSLDADTLYYWRVRAVQPFNSPWSVARSFSTVKTGVPVLSQPGHTSAAALQPLFRWSSLPGVDKYELRVSKDDSFASLVIERICGASLWQSDLVLEYKTGYYWKVRAWYGQKAGGWSAAGYFFTMAEPVPVLIPKPKMNAPKPAAPVSATAAEIEPVFRWSSIEGAGYYELLVAKNDIFSPVAVAQTCFANAWKCETTLDYASSYYWKVRAVGGLEQSEWSDVQVFTTKSQPASAASPTPSSVRAEPTPAAVPATPAASPNPSTVRAEPTPAAVPPTTAANPPPASPALTAVPSPTPSHSANQPSSPDNPSTPVPVITNPPPTQPVPSGTVASVADATAAPAFYPISTQAPPNAPGSVNTWLVFLVGGLTVLTSLCIGTIVFLLKKLAVSSK